MLDSLRGLDETQQYACGEERLAEMNARTDALAGDEQRMKRTAGRNQGATNTVILVFDLAMVFAAAALYQAGKVDFAGVLIPSVALMSSFGPVVALANLGSTLQSTFAAGNRVLDILDEEPVVADIEGRPELEFTGASAEDVRFDYGGETILDGVSADIPRGSIVGITGRSGSGKSTLLKLFMRFWEAKGGAVKVSGVSVNDINTANLRDMESFVTQETQLFHDSIRANLRIAKLDATDAELVAACKKASVHGLHHDAPPGLRHTRRRAGRHALRRRAPEAGARPRVSARGGLHAARRADQQSGQLERGGHTALAAHRARRQNRRAGQPPREHHAHSGEGLLRRAREAELMKRDTDAKREREKALVSEMIALYCRKKTRRARGALCPDCAALNEYARLRSEKCPFMETKTFCSNCRVHCYRPDMREKIREVMRFSGPRMLLHHPIPAIRHVIEEKREKRRLEMDNEA